MPHQSPPTNEPTERCSSPPLPAGLHAAGYGFESVLFRLSVEADDLNSFILSPDATSFLRPRDIIGNRRVPRGTTHLQRDECYRQVQLMSGCIITRGSPVAWRYYFVKQLANGKCELLSEPFRCGLARK